MVSLRLIHGACAVLTALIAAGCLFSPGNPVAPTEVAGTTPSPAPAPGPPPPPPSTHNGPTDFLAYWPMNGNAADTTGRWNGTMVGVTTAADRNGSPNSALSFDGISSFIDVGQLHPPVSAFSVALWMRPSVAVTTTGFNRENEIIGDAGGNRGFRLMQLGSALYFQAQGGGETTFFEVTQSDVGRWMHVAAVYDARQVVLYRNGQLVASRPAGVMTVGFQPLQIGRDPNVATSYWQGLLDEVRLYGRALSAGEIATLSR